MNLIEAEKEMMKLHDARDDLLAKRRGIIMKCAKGIRAVHTGNYKLAEKKLKAAKKELAALEKKTTNPKLRGMLLHCYQEVVELEVLLGVIKKGKLPEVDAPPEAYLTGVLDALGEMKRTAMGLLMKGEFDEAMKLHEKMEETYYAMEGMTFPNSLVEGFKHKQDVMKRVIERLYETLAEAKMRGNGNK